MRLPLKERDQLGKGSENLPAPTFNSLVDISVIKDNERCIPAGFDGNSKREY
jgi:hypothetical protein